MHIQFISQRGHIQLNIKNSFGISYSGLRQGTGYKFFVQRIIIKHTCEKYINANPSIFARPECVVTYS